MVRRNTDAPRDPLSRIAANASQLTDLARAAGRGTTAIRDSAGNVLQMNGEAPYPLLTPLGMDAAVAFTPGGTVKITDPTTTQDRDMTVRDITSSGSVTADGVFVSNGGAQFNGTVSTGQINAGTSPLFVGLVHCQGLDAGTFNIGTQGIVSSGANFLGPTQLVMGTFPVFAGDGHFQRIFCPAINPPSDARLKEAFQPVDEDLLDRLLQAPVQRWRWKARWEWDEQRQEWLDHSPDNREHTHPVAQDMPAELTVEMPDGHLAVDAMSTVGSLLALIQRQQGQIDELRAKIETLEATP